MKNVFLAHLNNLCERAEKTHLSVKYSSKPTSLFCTQKFTLVEEKDTDVSSENLKQTISRIYENFQSNNK
jgi:hypothetical protein